MKKTLKNLIPTSLKRYTAEKKRTRSRAALRRVTKRGPTIGTVIDVGASDGRWSEQAMDYFPDANYLLIEANPLHKTALTKFCKTRTNAHFEIAAASDKDGTVSFDGSGPFGGKAEPELGSATIETKAVRLDALVEENADYPAPYLLKLDTHGYEVPILDGAAHILDHASVVIIEVYVFRLSSEALLFDEMVCLMRSKGFGVTDISDPLWRPNDNCLWQMDLYFERLTAPSFAQNTFV